MHARLFSLYLTIALLLGLVLGDISESDNNEDEAYSFYSDDSTVTPTPDYIDYTFEYEPDDLKTPDYSQYEVLNSDQTRGSNKASTTVYRPSALLMGLIVQQFFLQR